MKKITSFLGLGACLVLSLAGCSNEDIILSGEGRVLISAKVNSDVKIASRADLLDSEDELAAQCMVWISNSKGVVRRFQGLDNIPASGITLLSDHYVAEAWTGDSVSASWDKRWYKGMAEFDVRANEVSRVALLCKIANSLVKVNYDSSVEDVLENYTFTVSHTRGGLTFEGNDDRTAYFMMPSADKTLTWKLQGTLKKDGSLYTREGSILDVKPAYCYNIAIKCTPSEEEFGGLFFSVTVDPTMVDVNTEINIEIAPQIEGYGFDLSKPVMGEQGNLPRRSVFVTSPVHLKDLVLDCADFDELIGIGGSDVNLLTMLQSVSESLTAGGITYVYDTPEDGTSMMKISFEKEFMNRLANGLHEIRITATDANDKTSEAVLTVNVSDAAAVAEAPSISEVWATTATVYGTISKDGVNSASIEYREKGTSAWTPAETSFEAPASRALANGTRLKAVLTDLKPATAYEYHVVADDFSTEPVEFTTGSAAQLPNASFENWQTSSNPYLIYGQGESMFWDSGNTGSAKMGKNVTVPTTEMVHDGQYAISLVSQFVGVGSIGAFAAGNVFIGQFLGTENTTKGILGWGRPFNSRPRQLKFWAHYTTGEIDYAGSPDPELAKGKNDRGVVYIALLDNNTESYGSYSGWPCIVATKVPKLFDPSSEHVIAYGVHEFTETTPGDQLVEVTIDLDYVTLDVIPSNIILTASASKGGDYYCGSTKARLVLDDLQLIY